MNCSGVIMTDYELSIAWFDVREYKYLQQGHCNDVSWFTFNELLTELNNERN